MWVLLLTACGYAPAQNAVQLTLQQCVDLALERNLQIRQLGNTAEIARVRNDQILYRYLPTFNGALNYTRNFGTTFNAFTFQRSNQSTDFSNPRLTLNWTLFSGLANTYALQQTLCNLAAAEYNTDAMRNTVLTNVLGTYMQIVFDMGNLQIQRNKMQVLEAELDRQQKRVEAGVAVETQVLNLRSQLATEQLALVNNQNQLERDKLQLLQLLQMDITPGYAFEEPDSARISVELDALPQLSTLVDRAIGYMPQIQQQHMNVRGAEWGIKAARATLYPTLSGFANLSSQYTSQTNSIMFDQSRTGYLYQMNDALQQSLGLQLNIPIFNSYTNRTNVTVSRLNHKNAQLLYDDAVNQLTREVQQAFLDVVQARTRYRTVIQQLTAVTEAFRSSERQYQAGAMNFFDYFQQLNNRTQVEYELLQARYDYFFKRKLLDVYQGKKIQF